MKSVSLPVGVSILFEVWVYIPLIAVVKGSGISILNISNIISWFIESNAFLRSTSSRYVVQDSVECFSISLLVMSKLLDMLLPNLYAA